MKNKPSILELIRKRRIYFDGGMGTMLQQRGLQNGQPPESWNLSNPNEITQVHKEYLKAGCDIITTNTFGVNSLKYNNYKELISSALNCAKEAVNEFKSGYIAFDIGPTGKMLEPYGDLAFEEAVKIYANNVIEATKNGADLIIIETMNDCYETKAAVIAAKENSNLPVFVTNVYDESQKLMTGASPAAMCSMLEGLGVDALGVNCSLGPDKLLPVIEELGKISSIPIIASPNAGLPKMVNGQTVYDMNSDKFADNIVKLAKSGADILGGCCGTTPEYISKTISKTKELPLNNPTNRGITFFSSYTHAVALGKKPILIGERINPTGKPKFKEALRNSNIDYIVGEGVRQAEKGVHALDVNVGLPEIDEVEMIQKCIYSLQAVCDLPLQIDTSNPIALEKAMRLYNGKPLVNSVNGKIESMKSIFPLIKKYGGVVIALTLDENGIPSTADERVKIAEKIIKTAKEYGVDTKDIIVDPLALAVSSDSNSANITLDTIKKLHKKEIHTSLGVSNISFGLPQREKINSVFFSTALLSGLDCAIMNPFSVGMLDSYYAFCALNGSDKSCLDYISYASQEEIVKAVQENTDTLSHCIVKGLTSQAITITQNMLKNIEPLDIINNHIIPALNEIGHDFETGKAFLPQLLMSADTAAAAFAEVKKNLPAKKGRGNQIILATVLGDIHDIGKNIVKVLLESYGFDVIDLGRDVKPEKVLDAVVENKCKIVGLSALMTTTVTSMEETVKMLHNHDRSIKIIVGGAVLNAEYAQMIGADYYSPEATDTVKFAQSYYKNEKGQ